MKSSKSTYDNTQHVTSINVPYPESSTLLMNRNLPLWAIKRTTEDEDQARPTGRLSKPQHLSSMNNLSSSNHSNHNHNIINNNSNNSTSTTTMFVEPKGCWAQRMGSTQNLIVKSYLSEDSVIPIPQMTSMNPLYVEDEDDELKSLRNSITAKLGPRVVRPKPNLPSRAPLLSSSSSSCTSSSVPAATMLSSCTPSKPMVSSIPTEYATPLRPAMSKRREELMNAIAEAKKKLLMLGARKPNDGLRTTMSMANIAGLGKDDNNGRLSALDNHNYSSSSAGYNNSNNSNNLSQSSRSSSSAARRQVKSYMHNSSDDESMASDSVYHPTRYHQMKTTMLSPKPPNQWGQLRRSSTTSNATALFIPLHDSPPSKPETPLRNNRNTWNGNFELRTARSEYNLNNIMMSSSHRERDLNNLSINKSLANSPSSGFWSSNSTNTTLTTRDSNKHNNNNNNNSNNSNNTTTSNNSSNLNNNMNNNVIYQVNNSNKNGINNNNSNNFNNNLNNLNNTSVNMISNNNNNNNNGVAEITDEFDLTTTNPATIPLSDELFQHIIDELNYLATFAKKVYHRAQACGNRHLCQSLCDGVAKAYVNLSTIVPPPSFAVTAPSAATTTATLMTPTSPTNGGNSNMHNNHNNHINNNNVNHIVTGLNSMMINDTASTGSHHNSSVSSDNHSNSSANLNDSII